MPTLVDYGINDIERTSIYWRQLIIFYMDYRALKSNLEEISALVEFDLPSELVVTSKLANGEFAPLIGAISCPWLDKDDHIYFNVGYNKVNNKCCISTFKPGDKEENKIFIFDFCIKKGPHLVRSFSDRTGTVRRIS